LVSIITPRYLQSKWCKDEIEAFFKAAEQTGGIAVENKRGFLRSSKHRSTERRSRKKFVKFSATNSIAKTLRMTV
jgi:hypothetical protein